MLQQNISPIVGIIEFSVGKFQYFKLNRPFPEEAILPHIFNNVTFVIFQIHSQYQNTTISFSKVSTKNSFHKNFFHILGSCI